MSKSLDFCKARAANPSLSPYNDRPWDKAVEFPETERFFDLALHSQRKFRMVGVDEHGNKFSLNIELCFDPDADFEYFTSECVTHDGTLIFELELASRIVQKICTGNTYNKSKGAPKSGDTLQYVIGNLVLLNEFDGDFIPPDKPWMAERSTMLLPIKMDIKGAVK